MISNSCEKNDSIGFSPKTEDTTTSQHHYSQKEIYKKIITTYDVDEIKKAILENDPIEEKLHVIAVMFNPTSQQLTAESKFKKEYEIRYKLFKEFAERMEKNEPNVILYVVELAYGDQEYIVTDSENIRHLQLRTEIPLWHRENMVNLAIKKLLPSNWKAVAWIDADIEFENIHWAMDTLKILNKTRNIVQLFSHCSFIVDECSVKSNKAVRNVFTSFGYNNEKKYNYFKTNYYNHLLNWDTGFGLACTRELYESFSIINDFPQFNYSSYILLHCINDQTYNILLPYFEKYNDYLIDFRDKILKANTKLGYVPGVITHHYHGRIEHRLCESYFESLRDWEFVKDILNYDENGILIVNNDHYQTQDFLNYFNQYVSKKNGRELILNDRNINSVNVKTYLSSINNDINSPPWGPILWVFLHTLSMTYNAPITTELLTMIELIIKNTPCETCSNESIKYLNENLFTLETITTVEDLQVYLFNFHNVINKYMNKPIYEINNFYKEYSSIDFISVYNEFLRMYYMSNEIRDKITNYFDKNINDYKKI
jgi:hypothetical protein